MPILDSTYQEIRRVAVASLAADFDPSAGELPPVDEWISVGAPQSLGLVRVVGIYVDANNVQVPGGTWDLIPVEPAIIEGIQGDSGISPGSTAATAVFGETVSGLESGEVSIVEACSASSLTIAVAGGTSPGGSATHLVILARKV
jgi:hypothetical protein